MGVQFQADIILRNGDMSDFDANKIKKGEPAVVTDEGRLFVGMGDGEAVEFASVDKVGEEIDRSSNLIKVDVAKNTASIKTIESKLAEANPNRDPRVSITSAAPSIDIPKTAAPGGVDVAIRGVTLTNRIFNGDFTKGTGWNLNDPAALSYAAAEKTMTVTVNAIGSSFGIYQFLSATAQTGRQYYISYEINPFRTHTPQIYFGAAVVAMPKTAEAGTFTRVSRLITPTATSNHTLIYINGVLYTAESDIGKQTKLRRVVLVDLTAHGLDGLTTEQLDYMTALYFDGTKSAVAPRFRSVDISGEKSSYQYIEPYTLRSIPGAYDEITGGKLIRRLNEDGVALVDPEIIENVTSGTLISYPGGTIYAEPAIADAGVYNQGISVFYTDFPIENLETVKRVDFETGEQMPLDASHAVISPDGKSFTHPDLADGDIVFFTYFYDVPSVGSMNTYSYLDSREVIADTVNGKFYAYKPVITNGVIASWTVEEV